MLTLDDLITQKAQPVDATETDAAPVLLYPVQLASDGLIAAWRAAGRSDLATVLLPKAIKALQTVLDDPYAKGSEKVAASRTVLEYTLGREASDQLREKPINEMTIGEIDAALAGLRELQEKAAQLTPAHTLELDAFEIFEPRDWPSQ